MKRFYCTTCKKVRRARKWPVVMGDTSAFSPEQRLGICDWHLSGRVRHVRVKPVVAAKATSKQATVKGKVAR
jgi:hypothetical protein